MHRRTMIVMGTLMAALALSGCSEPTIDASSERAFYDSAARISLSLDQPGRDRFVAALIQVAMDDIDVAAPLGEGEQLDLEGAIIRLDGMTAEEVMAEAEDIREAHGADPDGLHYRVSSRSSLEAVPLPEH